jgi:hypothetical protein
VIEAGQGAGLGHVGLDVCRRGDPVPVGHLDGYVAVEFVVAPVDDAKAPGAELAGDPITPQPDGEAILFGMDLLWTGELQLPQGRVFVPAPRPRRAVGIDTGNLAHGALVVFCCGAG